MTDVVCVVRGNLDYGELRPKSLAALLNKVICVGRTVKQIVSCNNT
jgi:hypothetical protein